MRFFLISALLFAFSGTGFAFDHSDRASLAAELQRLEADLEAGRFKEAAQRRAPRLGPWSELPADIQLIEVSFDLDAVEIRTTSTGVDYAVLPTTTVSSVGWGQHSTDTLLTFVFQQTGRWYFADLADDRDLERLLAAYPDFATIDFPNF